ncbi:MAG: acyclic terpene utilization AtuA family protein, partial [Bryobacteraceae bacterium]
MIRIANGQGFWSDSLEAPVQLVEQGPIDYLILDYLAEVTMSILQKQREADPSLGYARDFPPLIGRLAEKLVERKVKVIANAGGVNPVACAKAVLKAAPGLKVAVVLGDDLYPRLDELLAAGVEMRDMDSDEPLSAVRDRVLSANVYIGAFPLAEALATGANVVIAGRSTDTALALAPMIHRYGWGPEDWDKLAAGTIAGHIVECGAQCTGGNCQVDWESIPDMARIGYPIVEAEPDGTFTITKHAGTGGRVHSDVVKEQLLYELGDPKRYITPDCIADFTSIHLDDVGPDRVRVSRIRGGPRPPTLKVSISYLNGWKAIGMLVYSWPQAMAKA